MGYQLWMSPRTGYRRRGTTFGELNALFEKGLTTASISEPLRCCTRDDFVSDVRAELDRLDFDVAGVCEPVTRRVIGWIEQVSMSGTRCGEHLISFEPNQLVSDSTPLVEMIRVLAEQDRAFVVARRGVSGIVTRADLRKPPVRMLIFGLVSLLEMHLTYWVRELFPGETWRSNLSQARLEKVTELLARRQERKEDISEIDCLQLCDKRQILAKSEEARNTIALGSKKDAVDILELIEHLRDRVAHSQEQFVGDGGWPELAETLHQIERILHASESALDARVAASDMRPPQLDAAV